jgi:hypothetical protein
MATLRDRLSHVLWIGGTPHSGKTTLSRLLAGKYDLKIYNLDWHLDHVHRLLPGGAAPGWDQLSMDERWLLPTPLELTERDLGAWTTRARLVIDDLLQLPKTRTIVAEGPGVLPWWTAPLLGSERQAIFLVATSSWRMAAYERRYRSDPTASRDALLAHRIKRSCEELGLRWEAVDGSRDLDASLALVENHFGDLLPTRLNV